MISVKYEKGDSKSASIIYPPRVVPKVEPNTDPQNIQARNQVLWGQQSNAQSPLQQSQQPPQQRLSHRKKDF